MLSSVLSACVKAERPFRIVQLCLKDAKDLAQMLGDVRSVAAAENMTVVDYSAKTAESLQHIHEPRSDGSPVVDVDVSSSDGTGVGIGNLGLPGYQIALGFGMGNHRINAERFAKLLVGRLEKTWQVYDVLDPSGHGAFPLPDCK